MSAEEAWERFVHWRNQAHPAKAVVAPLYPRRRFLQMAAAVIFLLGAAWAAWLLFQPTAAPQWVQVTASDTPVTDTLPDGTQVTLNSKTQLELPEKFAGNTRRVKLKGEAFFHVTPDKQKPFVIEAGNTLVTVVGTSFNVRNRADYTEVIVETGLVQVAYHHQTIMLKPGEKVRISPTDTLLNIQRTKGALHQHFRTREFVCDNTRLADLAEALSEAYEVHIILAQPTLNNLPLSTTFHHEPLENILDIIGQTLDLNYTRNGDTIVLRQAIVQ